MYLLYIHTVFSADISAGVGGVYAVSAEVLLCVQQHGGPTLRGAGCSL